MKIIVTCFLFWAASCGQHSEVKLPDRLPSPVSSSKASSSQSDQRLSLSSVGLYAWWWSEQQLKSGVGEKSAAKKASYIRLERWKDTSDPKIPHPESFDVLCQIKNESDSAVQDGEFIILTTIDFVVAPTYLHNGDVEKIINEVGWGRLVTMDDVKMEKVHYLRPKETAEIKIKGFHLGRLLKLYNGEDDTLWLWVLRVNVRVLSRDMTQVGLGQAILQMIPADRRLSAK